MFAINDVTGKQRCIKKDCHNVVRRDLIQHVLDCAIFAIHVQKGRGFGLQYEQGSGIRTSFQPYQWLMRILMSIRYAQTGIEWK